MASRHAERINEFSKKPGLFVYNGSAVSVEHFPTPLKTGKKDPVFDASGAPVIDKEGNQVFETPGRIKKGPDGNVILGGTPKEHRVKMSTMTVYGVEFASGKAVPVSDPELARKLRCMPHLFDEKIEKTEKK